MQNFSFLGGQEVGEKTFSGRPAGWPAGWPAKPDINANLSPAWISLAWAELGKMIYAPWNEFCMIWVIFWMPTDQVMAFLCFIFDNQSVDMSGQVWGGGRGGHNWKKQVCLKMLFRQFQVFLAHVFFSYWKIDPRWPPPSYWNFPIIFFLKPSLREAVKKIIDMRS